MPNYIRLEDDSGRILLEDASGDVLLENQNTPPPPGPDIVILVDLTNAYAFHVGFFPNRF